MSKLFYRALGETSEWPNLENVSAASLTYNDVILLQQYSEISSRSEVDTSTELGPYLLKVPFISAPMDTIFSLEFGRELHRLGGIASVPRSSEIENSVEICKQFTKDKVSAIYSIGINDALENSKKLEAAGAKVILIDTAHGGLKKLFDAVSQIKSKTNLVLIAGNISNYDLAVMYKNSGVDIARVGVGAGSVCETRVVAGTGFPTLSGLLETVSSGIPVIADGGIKVPADVAKAFAAGAKYSMMGSVFSGTDEVGGLIIDGKMVYEGQASSKYMERHGVSGRVAEGIATVVDLKGPLKGIVEKFTGGLRSAMSYSGAHNLEEFSSKALFVYQSGHSTSEGYAHIHKNY